MPPRCQGVHSLLSMRRQGRKLPIRRLHNQRRSPVGRRFSPLPPELVIGASGTFSGRAIGAASLSDLRIPSSHFLGREKLLPSQLTGSF